MIDSQQLTQLKLLFASRFGAAKRSCLVCASAPGRLELAGNHTDHQGGPVLSAAVDMQVFALAAPSLDTAKGGEGAVADEACAGAVVSASAGSASGKIRLRMEGFGACDIDLDEPGALDPHPEEAGTSAALVRGMVAGYVAAGGVVRGFDMVTVSTLPAGAGVSSSAAFEMLVGSVLRALDGGEGTSTCGEAADPSCANAEKGVNYPEHDEERVRMALQGQMAEQRFFGKSCGAQDQLTSAFGGTVFMDFSPAPPAAPQVQRVDFDPTALPYTMILIDSKVDHAAYIADYDAVPRDMFAVAGALGAPRLHDAGEASFLAGEARVAQALGETAPRAWDRARHFFAEADRVQRQFAALGKGDFATFARLAGESGHSNRELLRNVTPSAAGDENALRPERIMEACDRLLGERGVCRMHGGGFGGCILALVEQDAAPEFVAAMNEYLGYDACLSVTLTQQGACAMRVDPELPGVVAWTGDSAYGPLEITINLRKPEKDPRAIAAAAAPAGAPTAPTQPAAAAPTEGEEPATITPKPCDLCREVSNFNPDTERARDPRVTQPEFALNNERWMLHFSPYGYYPLHCIFLPDTHRPMAIDRGCLTRMLACVDRFPYYFVGSNADLPIVGGSILAHDHFQGGGYVFPLMRAPIQAKVQLSEYPQVSAGIVRWPASTLRLESADAEALINAAEALILAWQNFDYAPCDVIARSGVIRHNTVTPIAYLRSFVEGAAASEGAAAEKENAAEGATTAEEGATQPDATPQPASYILDLVLRNNRTTPERPFGLFHPDESLHHIKKENIGLIEIMGRAILPGRLVREIPGSGTGDAAAQAYIADAFARVLEATGVFKDDDAGRAGWETLLGAINGQIVE